MAFLPSFGTRVSIVHFTFTSELTPLRRPYFGQAGWFRNHHPEKLPSAIERYEKETRRVLGVLESVLSKQDYLVGGKITIADISFVSFNDGLNPIMLGEDFNFEAEFPRTAAYVVAYLHHSDITHFAPLSPSWHAKVSAVEGVKRGLEERSRLYAEYLASKAKSGEA